MLDTIKGKYKIVREIARSNDIVYEATDVTLGRRIAIKELNIPAGATGQARRDRIERFNREARAAGRLSHPNIVSVTDFGEEDGRYFIAMEFLEGQSLRDAMQVRGAYSLREALDIISQVLDALAYAHANKVIHRDVKPDNIHVLPGGQVKLTDFGIARLTEEAALTSDGQVFGTPSYMSPEQIEGRTIDLRSDLFSVGILLYEMLAGRKPFIGDNVVSITYAIMNSEMPPLNGVPPGIEQVIRRALSKSPLQRQTSADQLRQDLRNAEQTPAAFLGGMQQTGMGQMPGGMGGAAAYGTPGYGSSPAPGYGPPNAGYGGANTGYGNTGYGNPGYGANAGAYAPPMPPPVAAPGQPWAWNNGNNAGNAPAGAGQGARYGNAGAALPSVYVPGASGPVSAGLPPVGAGGIQPYAAPPFPAAPAGPLFTLSDRAKTTLLSLLAAIVLGGGLAFGVIAFLRGYSHYQEQVGTQQVAESIRQGDTQYNNKQFAAAAKLYQQAMNANPNPTQKNEISLKLGYCYIQQAQIAKAKSDLNGARDLYRKALDADPNSQQAHGELATVMTLLGDVSGARVEQQAAQTASSDNPAPDTVRSNTNVETGANAAPPNQFLDESRKQAQQLIADGDALLKQGDSEGARRKWMEAIGTAPGTAERDAAQQRLDQTKEDPNLHE